MTVQSTITCCQLIWTTMASRVADSVIGEMIVTDYYDGPLAGFLRCPTCGQAYHFLTLDWSAGQFIRVISLAPIPSEAYAHLIEFFGQPDGKKWVPPILRRASDEDLDCIEPFVSSIALQAGEPVAVIAWNVSTTEVLAARGVDNQVSAYVVSLLQRPAGDELPFDWFTYLGLTRII